jgi:phage terminase large subunit
MVIATAPPTGEAALERCLQLAAALGVARDQIGRFLRYGYIPQPKQLEFHAACRLADQADGPIKIAYGGARGPGKSHASFTQLALDDCQRQPGLKALFLRKIGKSARESFVDLVGKTLPYINHSANVAQGRVEFPNGSVIITGNYRTESDIEKYLGLEYDVIVIEEVTQLSQARIDMLEGSLRTSKPNWRPRMYYTTNPGGVGHVWFKEMFVRPWRAGRETLTRFIQGTYLDNAFLNPEYRAYLERLTGVLGRMWREGDWDISAGAFFTTWDYERHTIKPLWDKAPHGLDVWLSLDYGFSHPTAVYWHAKRGSQILTFAEHVASRWLVAQHARRIHQISDQYGRNAGELVIVAGHDAFSQRGDKQGRTVAEQYAEEGLTLTRANIDRLSGAAEMLRRLGNPEAGIDPTWQITRNCRRLIETIPAMQTDPKRPEDVLKVDADTEGLNGDDPYDSARYGLMYRDEGQAGRGLGTTGRR